MGCNADVDDSGKRSLAERLNQATKVNASANTNPVAAIAARVIAKAKASAFAANDAHALAAA